MDGWTDLGDVPEVEEVVDFGWSGKHPCGDEVIDVNSSLCHGVAKGLHILVKILQLLVDHGPKDTTDLTFLKNSTCNIRTYIHVCMCNICGSHR